MACCPAFNATELANITADLSGCTLTFTDSVTGDICYQFRLPETIVLSKDNNIKIRDGMSTMNIPAADLLLLGLTAQNIIDAADACRQASGGGGGSLRPTNIKINTGFTSTLTATGETVFVEVVTDEDGTGVSTYRIHSATGVTTVADLSTLTLSGVSETGATFKLCYIDDTASDGSNLVEFVRIISIDSTGTATAIGDFLPDLVTPYTVIGTVETSETIGSPAEIKQLMATVEDGGTWSPTSLVRSYSFIVVTVGDINTPPTYTDSNSNSTDLLIGESGTFSLDGEADLMETTPTFSTNTGDLIRINYTTL
jgi:hypothetical protein